MSENTDHSATPPHSDLDRPLRAEFVPPPKPPLPPSDDVAGAIQPMGTDGAPGTAVVTEAPEPLGAVVPKHRRLGGLGIAAIALGLAAAAGWIAFGLVQANLNSTNDALVASAATLKDVNRDFSSTRVDLIEVTTERDQLKDSADAVAAREAAVEKQEADVTTREAAVKVVEDYQQATTLEDGYSYTVGLTMEPGTYRTNSADSTCYWAIYTSGTNTSDIVQNDLGAMGAISVTVSAGQDFTSHRCGDWMKVG